MLHYSAWRTSRPPSGECGTCSAAAFGVNDGNFPHVSCHMYPIRVHTALKSSNKYRHDSDYDQATKGCTYAEGKRPRFPSASPVHQSSEVCSTTSTCCFSWSGRSPASYHLKESVGHHVCQHLRTRTVPAYGYNTWTHSPSASCSVSSSTSGPGSDTGVEVAVTRRTGGGANGTLALGSAAWGKGAGGGGEPKCFLGRTEANMAPLEDVSRSPRR